MDVIFILGMHRSGTSCLAEALEACGLHLGAVVRTAGAADNGHGTFENIAINDINEALLGSWLDPRAPYFVGERMRGRIAQCAADLIASANGHARVGIKDPRMVFTLPWWRPHFARAQFVASIRNPHAVHASLMARGDRGTSVRANLHAWKAYNTALLDRCARDEVHLTSFDTPPDEYRARLATVCARVGLTFDEEAVSRAFAPQLRRQQATGTLDDPDADALYAALMERYRAQA